MNFFQHTWRITVTVVLAILGAGIGVLIFPSARGEVIAACIMLAFLFGMLGIFVTYFLLDPEPTYRGAPHFHGMRF